MIIRTTLFSLALLSGASAFAGDAARDAAKEVIPLKSGDSLYIFKDGLMAKESAFGTAMHIRKGEVLEAADGRKIEVTSNEVARMSYLINKGHTN